jgi:hypothetical protein
MREPRKAGGADGLGLPDRRLPSRSRLILAVLAAACMVMATNADGAHAWPGNDRNLCAAGEPLDQVTTVNPITGTNGRGETGVWTIRACSPDLRLPALGTASPTEMYKTVQPQHVMQGGARAPFISRGRLAAFPFVKGPAGQAVRYQELLGNDILIRAIGGAVGGVGTTVVIGVVSCLAGLVPTGGISCLAIPAAAVAGIVGAIGGVIQGVIENQLDRVITMASSDWDFHVPPGWKGYITWNGFGTIGHSYIDPSFTNWWPGGETPPFRMWAWFSAYPVAQGPNPDARAAAPRGLEGDGSNAAGPISAADVNPQDLHTLNGEITKDGPDEIVETSRDGKRLQSPEGEDTYFARGDRSVLVGGADEDVLVASGRRDRLRGGGGEDALVTLGRRNALRGGAAFDELIAVRPQNRLDGGAGGDTLVSEKGRATLVDRKGSNRFFALNGRSSDRIICGRGNGDVVVPDAGDRVSRSCEFVFVDGEGAPPSPTQVGERGFRGSLVGTRPLG